MLLSSAKFSELSARLHPQISVSQWPKLFSMLEKNGLYATNKDLIFIMREFFKTTSKPFSQVECYEFFSKLSGEKNWNTAKSKNIEFARLFTSSVVEGKIRTMIPSLDRDLEGGLPRKGITSLVSGTNMGKTLMCISLGCNFIRQGIKVIHVNLEGVAGQTNIRYSSNLSNLEYKHLLEGHAKFNTKTMNKQLKNLQVIDWLDFNCMVEDLDIRLREIYKDFKFDVLIIDYLQLLSIKESDDSYKKTMRVVYSTINQLSIDLNCAVISPAQATRVSYQKIKEEQGNVLKTPDISEFKPMREISKVVLTLNRNEEEVKNEELRLYLDKNEGSLVKDKTYKIKANFSKSNLLIKEII